MLLNELAYGEETRKLARLPVEDFKQYVASRKEQGRQVLLIVDEFSAIADGERMARVVEVVRSYGAALVLAPHALEGMGGAQAAARIHNAAQTIFLHAVPDPEQIVRAGRAPTSRSRRACSTPRASRSRSAPRANSTSSGCRRTTCVAAGGMCFVIGSGLAQKVQIAPTPRHAAARQAGPAPAPSETPGPTEEPVRL